ncbi:hypothetical protein BV20DRAFT_961760 [Pilatotrama ljubarskyi]|nr:hypothetical protein BV20DRAFT_961760 [Pilatotrama ljubarskyi]
MKYSVFVALSLALAASASPRFVSRASFSLQNGKDAIALNQKFATLTADSPCTAGENACVDSKFAQCVNGKFVTQACAGGLVCAALPLVNSPGTSITCTTAADRDARIAATGATAGGDNAATGGAAGSAAAGAGAGTSGSAGAATSVAAASTAAASTSAAAVASSSAAAVASSSVATVASSSAAAATGTAAAGNNAAGGAAAGGAGAGDDAQTSLTLLQSVIATGFANDGQDQPTAGQVPSLTSTNNFINFCATVNLPITNGKQIKTGSCNPAPMGVIASVNNMPSSKFVFPKNGGTVPANQNFTIQMAIQHLETGHFTNAQENYFAAPQVVNAQGDIQGHSHVVIDKLTALDQTTPTDPLNGFVFFKGLNDVAENGILSVTVPGGLPAGAYRLASINAAANHQPALVAIAQHGSLDDMVYFTVA